MDYATPNNGAVTAPRKPKAKTAFPKRRAVPFAATAHKRCRRGTKGQPAICTAGAAAYGFLKCQFLPKISQSLPEGKADEQQDFYDSFALLCAHYGISPLETRTLGYPYGRAVALWAARRLLRASHTQSIEILPITDADGRLVLRATETYCTGNTLYYIPVVPLYHLLKARSTKRAAQLLLCACAYLYHRAGVPYYRDGGSYLNWQYDMLREWVEDDPEGWEDGSLLHNRSQFNTAEHIGDVMQRRLWNPCHLEGLGEKVAAFVPKDSFGGDCLAIAKQALRLLVEYPNENLYRHADQELLPEEEDGYENDCITMDKYISFCAETKGWLYYNLSECVNNEFNECTEIQEPVLRRSFVACPQPKDSLDFEVRLFRLIHDLCYILNNHDYGNNS